MVCLTLIAGGALLPFFMHNVFGKRSRMFIGDGGTLMLGMLLTVLAFGSLSSKVGLGSLETSGICIPALVLAVGCIPIFDALRVMTLRMSHGKSPLKADKSHLHHLFIEIGFSHVGTAMAVITLNVLNIICWFISYQLGVSATGQFIVVVIVGMLNTMVFYYIVRKLNHDHLTYRILKRLAKLSHIEHSPFYNKMRRLMDSI